MQTHTTTRLLRLPQVREKTGISTTQVYRLVKRGKFPAPFKLSERVTVWNEAEIDAWLAERLPGGAQ